MYLIDLFLNDKFVKIRLLASLWWPWWWPPPSPPLSSSLLSLRSTILLFHSYKITNIKSSKQGWKEGEHNNFINNRDEMISQRVFCRWNQAWPLERSFPTVMRWKIKKQVDNLAMIWKLNTKSIIIRRFYAHLSFTFPLICQIETITWWDSFYGCQEKWISVYFGRYDSGDAAFYFVWIFDESYWDEKHSKWKITTNLYKSYSRNCLVCLSVAEIKTSKREVRSNISVSDSVTDWLTRMYAKNWI